MTNLTKAEKSFSEPVMSDEELAIFVTAFELSGFTDSKKWVEKWKR